MKFLLHLLIVTVPILAPCAWANSTESVPQEVNIVLALISVGLLIIAALIFHAYKKRTAYMLSRSKIIGDSSIPQFIDSISRDIDLTKEKIDRGTQVFNELNSMLENTQKKVDRIDTGLIPPVFSSTDSEDLKGEIYEIREKQYQCIKSGRATTALSNWEFFGSKAKGKEMISNYKSLLLDAYNAEFEVLRKQMRVSSLDTAIAKLHRLTDQLEKLGETARVRISDEFADLKLDELYIWYDELVHVNDLKEQRKKEKARLREQAKLAGDDVDELDEELATCDSELARARAKAEMLANEERAAIELQIQEIEEKKKALAEKHERAISQAQLTRAGYVYVISNIGSFGKGVIKIGMTRRLEPMDRVKELGDASVPFSFDVHTLAFSEDAPGLETALHEKFSHLRVNIENHRKEFFRVEPKAVQDAMEELQVESDWFLDAEARSYYESQLIRSARDEASTEQSDTLPDSI